MSGLTGINSDLTPILEKFNVETYSVWVVVQEILSKYREEADTDWELASVSSGKIVIETNPIHGFLYQYDKDLMIKDLAKENIIVDSIVFKVKKTSII
jgi:hypothetical protein